MGDRLKGPHEKNVWILSYLVPKFKKKIEQKTGSHWKTCGPPEKNLNFSSSVKGIFKVKQSHFGIFRGFFKRYISV